MVVNVILLLYFLFAFFSEISGLYISENEYNLLPPIYHIDPYDKCLLEKKNFCRVSLKLTPLSTVYSSKTWNLIEKTKKCKWHYNHDELFHAICVENHYKNISKSKTIERVVSELYAYKYADLGLKATVQNMDCGDTIYYAGFFDKVFLFTVMSYIFLIIFVTIYDITNFSKSKNKLLILFSLRHNIIKLKSKYQEADFEKLKCIQGIRLYTTLLIIFCHTYGSFIGGYVSNTEYFENFSQNFIKRILISLFPFLVQTFFLISAWLLSYHSFKIFAQNKGIKSLKYVLLMFWNRYLRICPPLFFMVSLNSSLWIYECFQGPLKKIYSDSEYHRCQKNWWINFLFINNFYKYDDMCYFISWYLASDTQLYLLSLILLAMSQKLKQKTKFMAACILTGILTPSIVSFVYDLDFIFRVSPENSKNNMFRSFSFFATYTSPHTNMASFMVGIMFGYIFYKSEDKFVFTNKFFTNFWWILFFGLPGLVLIVSCYEYDKVTSAVLAGILRPIYSVGVGIGIFVMSHQNKGLIKKFFEWKPIFFLGNITYSTYISQYVIVFSRTIQSSQPLYVSDYILLTSFVRDASLSFACGFLLHLLLEMPALQMQNTLVPKIRAQTEKDAVKKRK